MTNDLIQGPVQYVIPLSVAVILAVASLIIGFLLNAVTFWNTFTTRSACSACRTQCRSASTDLFRLREEFINAQFTVMNSKIDLYTQHTDELFKHYRLLYGAVMAIAAKLNVQVPNIEKESG